VSADVLLGIFRNEAGERLEAMDRQLLAVEQGEGDAEAIDELLRHAHSLKGTAGMVGFDAIAEVAAGVEDLLASARTAGALDPTLTTPLLRAVDAIRAAVEGDQVDAGAVTEELAPLDAAARTPLASPAPVARAAARARPEVREHTLRVTARRVDELLDVAGEAVLHRRRLDHLLGGQRSERVREELQEGEALLDRLQHGVLELRTFPLSSIVGPFPRLVRDVAAAEGREVELALEGVDTQLDRAILEGVGDLVVHLLRNAVAHGIEPPDAREAAGKPRRGRIVVRAESRGATVAVSVSDDGRGIAAELLARAGDDDDELVELLSTPGFSTAERVGQISGRGVGLDSVRRDLERLGGALTAKSEPGLGSTFTLRLPATLAVLQVLLVERAGQHYGIPLPIVEELLEGEAKPGEDGGQAIAVRGVDVPLFDLIALLGDRAPAAASDGPVAALHMLGRRLAVRCDSVLGEQEAVVKPLGPLVTRTPGYLGATLIGDGEVALILDPRHLVRAMLTARPLPAPAPAAEPAEAARSVRVLVVDDQVTVRELERRILSGAGYDVLVAGDGREALELLHGGAVVDLVVTDLEMPELDGLELVTELRADPRWQALPVVVVSSRDSEADLARAAEAGADSYVIKSSFDAAGLLETVARLVAR
jgi:two-component system chemotaxis sensor kinase CheA